jgi:hypothetical protein
MTGKELHLESWTYLLFCFLHVAKPNRPDSYQDWLGHSILLQKTDTSAFLNRNAKRLDVLNQMFGEDFF